MDKKMKHLELIQSVVNRMSGNSFMLKGWAITLIAGIFALAGNDAGQPYFLVAYIPVIAFWGLDAYYLLQERLYRSLYDKVCQTEEADIDFSLKAVKSEFQSKKNHYFSCLTAVTEAGFYLPLAIACTVVMNCMA
ncbi:MAG: hypothetical protein NC121_17720 [Blautia sp.]|nr:hypothetical protein [Blautia sp.]